MTEDGNKVSINRESPDFGISEAILLAAAPFFAYVFTFAYQAGYLSTFGLPWEFISINLTDVLNIGGRILGRCVLVLGAVNVLFSLLPKKIYDPPLVARIVVSLPIVLLVAPSFWLSDSRDKALALALLLLIIMVLLLPPVLTRRFKGSYLQRMEALDKETPFSNPWEGSASLVNRLAEIIGPKAFRAAIFALLSIYLVYSLGRISATTKRVFPTANTSPEAVVLFMTNDRLITAPFDPKEKTIEPVFTVINLGDNDFALRLKDVGPLKLKTKVQ